jgi:adenylosuccinate synthase
MNVEIFIGANNGDEAKGTVVARRTKAVVCAEKPQTVLNVLTNGGAQRGHMVVTPDGPITYKHFGSGTYFGADNYYSRFFILNPVQFAKEHKGTPVWPNNVYRDPFCRWTTIYDMFANYISERLQHRQASCCMGIWNTIRRTSGQKTPTFDTFMSYDDVAKHNYLRGVKQFYEKEMTIPSEYKDVWDNPELAAHFIEDCEYMYKYTIVEDLAALKYDNIFFENGQGLLISDKGVDSFDTTPSNTGIQYSLELIDGLNPESVTAHYVSRPYLTRHGDGFLEGESNKRSISSAIQDDLSNPYNDFQGMFRYGVLDVYKLYDRVRKDAGNVKFELELTHCDEMDRVKEFKEVFETVHAYDTALV